MTTQPERQVLSDISAYFQYLSVRLQVCNPSRIIKVKVMYTQAVLKFTKLITEAQQREAVTQGRSLL
ncbi:MAG: hypothetical protein LBL62_04765, partial [Planctomycetaceae bacterium]|nr:hypothetical protein [Planctomycetaceae bacterium]